MFKIIAQPEGGQNFVEENHMQINVMGLRTSQPSMNKVQQALKKGFGELVAKHFISAFQRAQTGHRVKDTLQAMLTQGVGRRTLTNSLVARGLEQKDWSADYRAFSVGKWDPVDLFEGVFKAAVPLLGREGPVVLGIDDTGLPKTGVNLEFAGWIHNPLVPKYVHPAIQWGIPILHAALLIQGEVVHRPTAISVAFEPIQREKKEKRRSPSKQQAKGESCPCPSDEVAPSKKCGRPTKEETALRQAERDAVIRDEGQDLTGHAVTDVRLKATELAVRVIWRVRKWMDAAGMPERTLVVVGDNSYTNGTVMLNLPHHTLYVGRTRPDSQLQAMGPTTKGGRFTYGPVLPTPREMAIDQLLEVKVGKFHYAGALRSLKFREKGPVFRKNSTRGKFLRLLILDPVPYGKGKTRGYNQRAFLLSTDLNLNAEMLIAAYLMRWELEVIHRIWKTDLGIGDAQVRKNRIPAAMAAYFALLLVANRLILGEERNEGYGPLTKWAANRRKWFEGEQAKDGKPKPRYRASPTELKTLLVTAMARKGAKVLALVA